MSLFFDVINSFFILLLFLSILLRFVSSRIACTQPSFANIYTSSVVFGGVIGRRQEVFFKTKTLWKENLWKNPKFQLENNLNVTTWSVIKIIPSFPNDPSIKLISHYLFNILRLFCGSFFWEIKKIIFLVAITRLNKFLMWKCLNSTSTLTIFPKI